MVNNKTLRSDFGVLFSKERGIQDIKQNRINNFVTENGIRVEAHSTQESVRGRIHLNQRPDFLLLDDIETNKTKTSEAYTKQVRDHMTEAQAGMSPDGFILYLGNYITEYGNIQWLMDRAKNDKGLRIRNVPIVIDGKPTWEAKYAMTDEEAKATGKVSIEDKQRQLGSLVFSYEMMNQPIDEMMAEFKKDFAQFETMEKVRTLETRCYVTIDSAVSEKDSADFTGITINWVSDQNKWYVKTYRLKVNSKDLIDHLFYIKKTYNPTFIGLEETTFTMAIQPFMEEEMRKRNEFFSITPVKHRGINKEVRIRGLIPRWENRSVFLVGDNTELLDEMRTFPNGQHDDVLDSFSMQVNIAKAPFRKVGWRDEDEEKNPAI
jgi:phage terminase large subunit-like protein